MRCSGQGERGRVRATGRGCALLLALMCACGSSSRSEPPAAIEDVVQACPPDATCDFEMELGVGLFEYTAVQPNDDIEVTLGPQGGFHVWLAARCLDCAGQVLIEYGVRGSADEGWLTEQPLRGIVNLDDAGTWRQKTGLYGLLPGSPDDVDYVDLQLALEVTIEDGDRRATRTVPVHVASVEVWDCPSSIPDECR